MRPKNAVLIVLVAGLSLATAACGDAAKPRPIDETRPLAHPRPDAAAPLDTKSRMGVADAAPSGFRHPPMNGADLAAAAADPDTGGLTWKAPDGWTQGPAKQMRVVTFVPAEAPGVECYVTVLGGAAGGVLANVNRWRQQLRLAPLAADAVGALPTVPVLGRPSPMVEIDGGAVGLFGLVCELGERTVFVKMTGPMEALRAQRGRFTEFCKSLGQ